MNYIGLNKFDTANGEGVRVSLFVSGCTLHCKGCFNKEAWDFNAGKPFTSDTIKEILKALENPYVKGFSVLGGDPFEPSNVAVLRPLLQTIKLLFPEKDIWVWTGRTYKNLKNHHMLQFIDVLIDGAFVEAKADPTLRFRGSSNQKVIYLKEIK